MHTRYYMNFVTEHHEEPVRWNLEDTSSDCIEPKKRGTKKKEEFKMAICRNNITRRMKLVPNLLILIEQMNNALNRTIWYIHTIQLHKQYRNGPFDGYKVYLALF